MKTEQEHINEAKALLGKLVETLDAAAKDGFIIGFALTTDEVLKKTTLAKLTSAKSYI